MYYPYIIPECVNHNEFIPNKDVDAPKLELHSAGFFWMSKSMVIIDTELKSESLKSEPNLSTDSKLLSSLLSNSGQWAFIEFD